MIKNRFVPNIYQIVLVFGILLQLVSLPVAAIACDIDNNGVINLTDIESIEQSINTSPSGLSDPRDATRDGQITINDVRLCFLQCTLPLCTEFPADIDNDGDGFTVDDGDCHDGDAGINPNAIDISGNGIDENCDGIDDNARPIADAGLGQSTFVGESITLDASGSIDQDGDFLTFTWSLTRPTDSIAELSDSTAINPTFEIDVPGNYIGQLVVNDGFFDSTVDTVTITTGNSVPVADAGPDQTAFVNDPVTLDGSGSTDVDGDLLTFDWSLTPPMGSNAVLDDPTQMNPMFTIDLPGDYVAELIVNDGEEDSDPDTVTITTENSTPVADAGPDQTAFVNDIVTLDGSASNDVDGDLLTFAWSLAVPANSTATLNDPTSVTPFFTVDVQGDYIAELIVNDGLINSTPDTVTITTGNSVPVADAGPDQTPSVGDTVQLDGSGSSDVDGDQLSFSWDLIGLPGNSSAVLTNPTTVFPSLTIDVAGQYVAQLIVNDGEFDSDADTVMLDTANSNPVADAGLDQTVMLNELVTLDGSNSSDVDGDLLGFSWSLSSIPLGSGAALSDPSAGMPTFLSDLPGIYTAQLTVNDGFVDSVPDTVIISTGNTAPVANAGPDQTVPLNELVTLDGSGSGDVDNDPITFIWSFMSRPANSAATLSDLTAEMPTFVPDIQGEYVAQLLVNDGFLNSPPDTVTIRDAAPVVLVEDGQFSVSNSCALGYDHTTDLVWIYPCSAANILSYTTAGVAGATVTRPGESANDVDIDFASAAFTLGTTAVTDGTMLFINGETAVADIYITDKAGIAAPIMQATGFGNSHVVGGGFHNSRGTFFVVEDQLGGGTANTIAELNVATGAVVNSFSIASEFIVNFGDMDVCQSTGNLFVVSSVETTVAEFTPTGVFVDEYDLPVGVTGLTGIGMDDSTGEAWVSSFSTVFNITGMPCGPS